MKLGRWNRKAGTHQTAATKTGQLLANTMRAMNAMQNQNWPLAIQLWQNVIERAGDETPLETLLKLSQCLRQNQQFLEAEQLLEQPLRHQPEDKALQCEYAQIASSRRDWAAAAERWQKIHQRYKSPPDENIFVRLAEALSHNGQPAEAEAVINDGLKSLPDSIAVKAEAARLAGDQQKWGEAAKRWERLLDSHPGLSPQLVATAAACQRRAGQLAAASEIISRGLERHGRHAGLLVEQAEIANARRDWAAALKLWRAVLDGGLELSDSQKLLCRFNVSVIKRIVNIKDYKKAIALHSQAKKRRAVIYTAYSRGYDQLKLPEIIDPAYDYVCYTDDPQADGFGVFDIRPLPVEAGDPARTIRYPKTHPHLLFKDYELAIWQDTSIMITGDIQPLVKKFQASGRPLGSFRHAWRSSLDEEYMAVANLMKEEPEIMRRQIAAYHKEGFEITDFAENGLMLFDPKSAKLAKALETWWQQILKYSRRDQLSFGYSMQKHQLKWFPLAAKPENIRTHPDFVILPHHYESAALEELYTLLKT